MGDKMEKITSEKSLATNLSDKYGQQTWVRALVQAIPYVGGSLDTLVSAQGQRLREERLNHYVSEIGENVRGLEEKFERLITNSGEETFDLFRSHIENVDRCRSANKRKRFANILLNQVERNANWEEPDTATRILNSITDTHVVILNAICNAKVCPKPFEGLKITMIEIPQKKDDSFLQEFLILAQAFPSVPSSQLRLIVTELVSAGLVKDEGVGRWGATAMEKFSPLPTATWFISWIERG